MDCTGDNWVGSLGRCIGAEDKRPKLFLRAEASLYVRIVATKLLLLYPGVSAMHFHMP